MTDQQIALSLQTRKLQLSFWGKVDHFSIVPFFFFIPLLLVFFYLRDLLMGLPTSIRQEALLLFIPIALGLLFLKIQSDRLKFTVMHTTLSRQQLDEIIEKVGQELKWYPGQKGAHHFTARTHPSFFSGSWGEQITILFDENLVLVNSICDLNKRSSVVSMGRNRKNVRRLLEHIKNANTL